MKTIYDEITIKCIRINNTILIRIELKVKKTNKNKFFGEFDPGSGLTLAACLIHASRTEAFGP